jgi:hypothetical protein
MLTKLVWLLWQLWAMWAMVWAMFLTHIAHTKRRASTSDSAFVGNVVIENQHLQITLYSTVYLYMGTYTAVLKKLLYKRGRAI